MLGTGSLSETGHTSLRMECFVLLFICFVLVLYEIGSFYVALTGLEPTMWTRLHVNSDLPVSASANA